MMMLVLVAAVLLTDTACLVSRHGPNCMCCTIVILLRVYQQLLFSFTFQCFRTACVCDDIFYHQNGTKSISAFHPTQKNSPPLYHSGLIGETLMHADSSSSESSILTARCCDPKNANDPKRELPYC